MAQGGVTTEMDIDKGLKKNGNATLSPEGVLNRLDVVSDSTNVLGPKVGKWKRWALDRAKPTSGSQSTSQLGKWIGGLEDDNISQEPKFAKSNDGH